MSMDGAISRRTSRHRLRPRAPVTSRSSPIRALFRLPDTLAFGETAHCLVVDMFLRRGSHRGRVGNSGYYRWRHRRSRVHIGGGVKFS
jgi:hypothetical protein